MTALPVGARIGILGGGQLGRMFAMAARQMGFLTTVMDPATDCCAASLCDAHLCASFEDTAAAAQLAQQCAAVTFEIEKIPEATLQAVAQHAPLRPGAALLHMVQDKARQKTFLHGANYPTGRFAIIETAEQIAHTLRAWQCPGRLKLAQGGYDGRGQAAVEGPAQASAALAALGQARCILEEELSLVAELSVLVARRPGGEVRVYPASRNIHRGGILHSCVMPASGIETHAIEATRIAVALAHEVELEGLLAVEFFVTERGALLINELAPRPHNTFHTSMLACSSSQFDNHVRAVCDWPLGASQLLQPVALVNLLGDLWAEGPPPFAQSLIDPHVHLALYGKAPRPGRKMGHLLALGVDANDALRRGEAAFARAGGR